MRAHRGDLFVVGEDFFGQYQVGLQQRLSGAFHRNAGQTAHLSELRGERSELFVVGGPHEVQATSSSARTSGRKVSTGANHASICWTISWPT